MSKVLITGGAGFIGSNLAHALVERGDEVRILDDLSTGRMENLRGIQDRVLFREGDIRDIGTLLEMMEGVDYVLHQAALASVARSVESPSASFSVNVVGSFHVLEAARASGVRRLVYAASSSVYGETEVLPKVETMIPQPISPYGVYKHTVEHLCEVWTRVFDFECVALRYFNVFGPRQRPDSEYAAVIPKFISMMQDGQRPVLNGEGTQTRDFCYVENVVAANLAAMVAPEAPGKVFNIACGERTSLLALIAFINGYLGTHLEPQFAPPRPGDIQDSLADIEAAKSILGYQVRVPFIDGLARTLEWYRDGGAQWDATAARRTNPGTPLLDHPEPL